MSLKRQVSLLLGRVTKLENDTRADVKQPGESPAELNELEKENEILTSNAVQSNRHINELSNELQRVRNERDAFKVKAESGQAENLEIIKILRAQLESVGRERDCFKLESDNQAAAWKEIKTFIPDYAGDGLSLVGMVRRHVETLRSKLATAEKEAQRQYEECCLQAKRGDDNYFALTAAKKELDELKANNRFQAGWTAGAQCVIQQVRELAAKLHD